MGVPPNGWFIGDNPTSMDDFRGTPLSGNHHMYLSKMVMFYIMFNHRS